MKVISLFSGVGTFDYGFHKAGWQTVHLCEWDKHARQVLRARFPGVPITDDVRDVKGSEITPADCIMFGSPCQDISVAGKRSGMAEGGDSRSSLFFEAVRIIREMREHTGNAFPRFALWENVPGAFSSNGGRDFAEVVRAFLLIGARDVSWRVLDSQHFGVPQRRRRIFLVADFGGERAEEILSERKGVSWHSQAGIPQRKDPAAPAALRAAEQREVAMSLLAARGGAGADFETETLIPFWSHGPLASTLTTEEAQRSPRSDGSDNLILAFAFDLTQITSSTNGSQVELGLPAPTLAARSAHHAAVRWPAQIAPTLDANYARKQGANQHFFSQNGEAYVPEENGWRVRRLTPIECERLQGMPDSWTDVNGMADSHRYRFMGNGGTSLVLTWLAQRMAIVLKEAL